MDTVDSSIPIVLNIKGTKNDPQFTLYIGRAMYMGGWRLKKSKWANPYPTKKYGDQACVMYKEYVEKNPELMASLPELANQKLGCWCQPGKCHGDVLHDLYIEHVLNK